MAKLKLEDGTEVEAFSKDELDALVAEQVAGLKRKNEELLGETKSEREKRQELERLQAEAEEARAKQTGEFKTLYEKKLEELEIEKEERAKERQSRIEFERKVQQSTLEAEAARFAGSLTRDTARAEDLSEKFMKHAKHTDGGLVLEVGGVEMSRDQFVEHIKQARPWLIDGSGASGGGASGGGKGGGAVKNWNELTGMERVALRRTDPAEHARLKAAAGN